MIKNNLIHFDSFDIFNTYKLSANSNNTQYTKGINGTITDGSPDILWNSIVFIKDTQQQWTHGLIYNCEEIDGITIVNSIEELDENAKQGSLAVILLEGLDLRASYFENENPNVITTVNFRDPAWDYEENTTQLGILLFAPKGYNSFSEATELGDAFILWCYQDGDDVILEFADLSETGIAILIYSKSDGLNPEAAAIITELFKNVGGVVCYGTVISTEGEDEMPIFGEPSEITYRNIEAFIPQESFEDLYIKKNKGWEPFNTGAPIANDFDGGAYRILSAEMGKLLNEKINEYGLFIYNSEEELPQDATVGTVASVLHDELVETKISEDAYPNKLIDKFVFRIPNKIEDKTILTGNATILTLNTNTSMYPVLIMFTNGSSLSGSSSSYAALWYSIASLRTLLANYDLNSGDLVNYDETKATNLAASITSYYSNALCNITYVDTFMYVMHKIKYTSIYTKNELGWEELKTGGENVEIVNNLEDSSTYKALSANMGRVLNERILAASSGSVTSIAGTLNIKDLSAVKAAQKLLSNNQQVTYIITDANGNYPSPNSPTVYLDTKDDILDLLYRGNGDALKWLLLNKQAYYKVGNTWCSQTVTNYVKIPSLHLRTAQVGDLVTIIRQDIPASEFYSKYIDYNNLNLNLNATDKSAFDGYLVALGIKGLFESISDGEAIRRLIEGGYIYTAENNPEEFPETIMNPLVNMKAEGIRDITFYTAQITPNTENFYSGKFWTGNMTGPGIYSYVDNPEPNIPDREEGEMYTGYVSPDGTQTLVSMKDPSKVFTRPNVNEQWVKVISSSGVGKNTGGTGEIFNDYINNFAHTDHGHAEGQSCRAEGWNSHAEGFQTIAGLYGVTGNAHAEGNNTAALGNNSHAEGVNTYAEGHNSHAEGDSTVASNWNAHAEGYRTIASGNGAHAEGNSDGIGDANCWNVASGFASHTEGSGTQATNKASHAEGMRTSSLGEGSHSEGMSTIAKGMASHAEGAGTQAEGNYSHAEGVYNYYNIPSLIHSIGIGVGALSAGDESYRTNAHAITLDGKHYIYGVGGYEGKGVENALDLATVINSNKGNAWSILDYEFVDLGLSVRWASCNVGAESPEEFGDYFAWGETTPKNTYSSVDCFAHEKSMELLKSNGVINDNNSLIAAYDAATANWGARWRMPTLDEMKELIDNCTWEWTSVNGINGYQVTGPNSNSIFLPAAGKIDGSTIDYTYSYYWNSTKIDRTSYVSLLNFRVGDYLIYYENPYYGGLIRPVTNF